MSVYGKALGTYRRINEIKRSSEKISEARNVAQEHRLKSIRKAKDAQLNADVARSIGDVITTAGSYAMSQSNNISPELNKGITVGANVLSEAISGSIANPGNNANAGMSQNEFEYFRERGNPDFFNATLSGYQMSDLFEDLKRMKDLDSSLEGMEDDTNGLSEDQLRKYSDESGDFVKGKGYDFSNLSTIAKERINAIMESRGIGIINENDDEDNIVNPYRYVSNNDFKFNF